MWLLLLPKSVHITDRERLLTDATQSGITACQKRKAPSFHIHKLNKIGFSQHNHFTLVKKVNFTP
jgi:hypothetical protein